MGSWDCWAAHLPQYSWSDCVIPPMNSMKCFIYCSNAHADSGDLEMHCSKNHECSHLPSHLVSINQVCSGMATCAHFAHIRVHQGLSHSWGKGCLACTNQFSGAAPGSKGLLFKIQRATPLPATHAARTLQEQIANLSKPWCQNTTVRQYSRKTLLRIFLKAKLRPAQF